jgi:cell shape-determining protein MreC
MRKFNFLSIFPIFLILIFILSLKNDAVNKFRYFAISSLTPSIKINSNKTENDKNLEFLKLENAMLKTQSESFYEFLQFEQKIEEQIDRYKYYINKDESDIYLNDFYRRRAEELKEILKMNLTSIPAKVVFREVSSWSSSIWINVGENQNASLGKEIISKNSPVVLGNNLVGIVDFVGAKYSKVKLITDISIAPSVRSIRGNSQNRALLSIINSLKDHLFEREDILNENEKNNFFSSLNDIKERLIQENEDRYLAKGEIQGSSQPLFRSKGITLKGVGFNYFFSDEEGPIRDLETGEILSSANKKIKKEPLIKKGDLLITTGLDGVFPAGLNVATVSKVKDLKEGDFAYDIYAKPTAHNLNDLEIVFILPATKFEK